MDTYGFEDIEDFFDFVRVMVSHLGDLGFTEAHDRLSWVMECEWATSSELVGEIGLACEVILKRDGKRLPPCMTEDLERCLAVCKSAFK